ncbi:hypothetical protein AQJ64_30875 [Streptomyces griseoruber]|uniref:Uncharacterized protein n=1 Tax=Streptomyces griseoruber TaxID=1943 RepID=A0A101SQW6_9ACTN|nr:hypothetical protein AQJ64_30875 [Streptomyces griseoruber]
MRFARVWDGEPCPVADPAATATRLDEDTQTAYDALTPAGAELDPQRSAGLLAYNDSCSHRGLSHWADRFDDAPPLVPGVVNVSAEWVLKGVSDEEAAVALRRARAELVRQGWRVTEYENAAPNRTLRVTPDGSGGVSVSLRVDAFDGDRLLVGAYAEWARYPDGTPLDGRDRPRLPEPLAPAQLRKWLREGRRGRPHHGWRAAPSACTAVLL